MKTIRNINLTILAMTILISHLWSDITNLNGKIKFDINNDNQEELVLNQVGLGVGVNPSTKLHIDGNAIVSHQLSIGSSHSSNNLHLNGTIEVKLEHIDNSTTLNANSYVFANTKSGNVTLSLPDAQSCAGRIYKIKKTSPLNQLTIRDGGYIDQNSDVSLRENSMGSLSVISQSGHWHILNINGNGTMMSSENLIGWWKFDETSGEVLDDSSVNELNGSLLGTDFSFSSNSNSGAVNGAIGFNKNNSQYIDIDDNDILDLGRGSGKQITVSFWYKVFEASQMQMIISKRQTDNSSNTDYLFFTETGNLVWGTGSATDSVAWMKTTEPTVNEWHHIVGTLSSTGDQTGSKKLYIDGILVNSGHYTNKAQVTNQPLRFGRNFSNVYFSGLLDEVRIYNRSLSDEEVTTLFKQR